MLEAILLVGGQGTRLRPIPRSHRLPTRLLSQTLQQVRERTRHTELQLARINQGASGTNVQWGVMQNCFGCLVTCE